MTINTSTVVSMTEANQNFSKVTRLVDQFGAAVIFKNNAPRYLVIDFSWLETDTAASDEDVMTASRKFMQQYHNTFNELAKWSFYPQKKTAAAFLRPQGVVFQYKYSAVYRYFTVSSIGFFFPWRSVGTAPSAA